MNPIRIIIRDSNLSFLQSQEVLKQLAPETYCLEKIKSFGDKNKSISLIDNKIEDFFTRELDEALLQNKADAAIHSAKDLPFPLPKGITLAALTMSSDSSDCLVSIHKTKLIDLPLHARIGTSSSNRADQILNLRPDLTILSLRGSIEERIEFLYNNQADAIIVATCAMKRLGLEDLITEILPFDTHPLQGKLAITIRSEDKFTQTLFEEMDESRNYGKVLLVGFGPGNSELLTIKAHNELCKADKIFYDNLIDQSFLNKFNAEKIYVGKRKDHHSMSQDKINKLLYEASMLGFRIVRLKGGDPFVFGRGGEEMNYLLQRFIPVEIVPGVPAAIAAAALTGLPLTQRGISSSMAFCNGSDIENLHIPLCDTLVFYMGAANLKKIANKCIEANLKADTPVAVVSHVSLENQTCINLTLGKIINENLTAQSPSIILVGNTVLDHGYLSQNNHNKTLFTGTNPLKYKKYDNLVHIPFIQITKKPLNSETRKAILSDWDIVLFTSRYSVQIFVSYLFELQLDVRWFFGKIVVSIGHSTSDVLKSFGIRDDFQSQKEDSNGVLDLFLNSRFLRKKVLLPRSELGLNIIPEGLKALGYEVNALAIYQNSLPDDFQKPELKKYETIIFTSPSCVNNFVQVYGHIPKDKKFVFKGQHTENEFNNYKSL